MTVLNETLGPGSCIISEADHYYSRDVETVIAGAGVTLPANTVLGKITASGSYAIYNPANADGTQNVAAILIYPVTGTAKGSLIKRVAQVKAPALNWFSGATTNQKNTAIAALAALGIIAR